MKVNLILIFSLLITQSALSFSGFYCPKSKTRVHKMEKSFGTTLVITQQGQDDIFNPKLILPNHNDHDSYMARHSIYHRLTFETQGHFSYVPEIFNVIRMIRSNKKLRKGFDSIEKGQPAVKVSNMYCKALSKAIQNYEPY
jgi:hypothetical protein